VERRAKISRKTNETDINLSMKIDGSGKGVIDTGIGFFDHMLNLFARHGLFDLDVKAVGDLNVDSHHTVEDVGIVLGQAIKEALGQKESIKRFGSSYVPMDEALSLVVVDLGGGFSGI
jgi:imidazoleglycerol-phosphate dehydratase